MTYVVLILIKLIELKPQAKNKPGKERMDSSKAYSRALQAKVDNQAVEAIQVPRTG